MICILFTNVLKFIYVFWPLSLCMVSIQEWFLIKNSLWWHASSVFQKTVFKLTKSLIMWCQACQYQWAYSSGQFHFAIQWQFLNSWFNNSVCVTTICNLNSHSLKCKQRRKSHTEGSCLMLLLGPGKKPH